MLISFLTTGFCRSACHASGYALLIAVLAVGIVQAEDVVVLDRPQASAVTEIDGEILTEGGTDELRVPVECQPLNAADVPDAGVCDCCGERCENAAAQTVVVKTCFGEEAICVLPRDEVWLVSVRQSSQATGCRKGCHSPTSYEFSTQRLTGGQWQPDDLLALTASHQADARVQTVLMVHGNNTDRRWAITRGMQFYDRLIGQATACRPSVRLVIFDWDSEQIRLRPLQDYKIKSARAASLGLPMAFLLEELGGQRPLLAGYSLGVQVVLSAMRQLATDSPSDCAGYRLALIAPALDPIYACGDLATIPCNPYIADAELFVNHDDRVVRAAQFVSRKQNDNPTVEPTLVGLLDKGRLDAVRFRLNDVTNEVRNGHSMINYLKSPQLKQKTIELLRATANDAQPQTGVAVVP